MRNFETKEMMADIATNGETFTVVHGGGKGLGNVHFKSPVNVRPRQCTEGSEGESLWMELELKLIADIALVRHLMHVRFIRINFLRI